MWRTFLAATLCVVSIFGFSQRSIGAGESFVASVSMMIDRWDTTAQRHQAQDVACVGLRGDTCFPPRVRGYLEGLNGLPPREQIELVNSLINSIPYAPDIETYGVADYWATLTELMNRRAGDSEDFALAKYFLLRSLGFDSAQLALVVVHHPEIPEACFMQLHVTLEEETYVLTHRQAPAQMADREMPANALFRLGHDGVLRTKVATVASLGGVW